MSHEKFHPDDLFVNTIKAHPELSFTIYNSEVYINNKPNLVGQNANTLSTPKGYMSLYELNIDRSTGLIQPISGEQSLLIADRKRYNSLAGIPHRDPTNPNDFVQYTPSISGSYPMSASITRINSTVSSVNVGNGVVSANRYISALRVPAEKYVKFSKHFQLEGSLSGSGQVLTRNLVTSPANLINVPFIFFESTLKRGSVNLKYYITGSLIAECADTKQNGELIETTGSNVGATVGLVMYDEGILVLTASHNLDEGNSIVYDGSTAASASWMYFGAGANDGITHDATIASASFGITAKGTSYTQVMTMFCHARKGELNHSNNPTSYNSASAGQTIQSFSTSSYSYSEPRIPIKNIVSSSYSGYDEDFSKTTYISKVGIYDEDGNLIMIASLATPKRKKLNDEFTIKLTYDI
ncbi:MAG: hypothetical protein GOVbin1807_126 [Prokaryotic dsDNA virus sp.]|nr:MAG: hypothetical protein GOVbin1807_126 [Prokaryotic dsDNA virus sp.]|tara:strand:+ start:3251 stop:4486 length:1236 start_codon:yes stop_codon:yes gene_type:complete